MGKLRPKDVSQVFQAAGRAATKKGMGECLAIFFLIFCFLFYLFDRQERGRVSSPLNAFKAGKWSGASNLIKFSHAGSCGIKMTLGGQQATGTLPFPRPLALLPEPVQGQYPPVP